MLTGSAWAANAAPSNMDLTAPIVSGAVTYISGGVGEDQSGAFKRAAANYPLELEFVHLTRAGKGEYLAENPVRIRDRTGHVVLDTRAAGPFLLARLPAGQYRISAKNDGIKQRQVVVVRPHHTAKVIFAWW